MFELQDNQPISPLERLQQLQYGYPPSSLNLDRDEIDNRNLAMGYKELEEEAKFGF